MTYLRQHDSVLDESVNLLLRRVFHHRFVFLHIILDPSKVFARSFQLRLSISLNELQDKP